MKSSLHGESTSPVEVTHISSNGIWILAHNEELFLPYTEFPWFKDQTVSAILNVVESSPGHFCWPKIDVDLSAEMIRNPEHFPLKARSG